MSIIYSSRIIRDRCQSEACLAALSHASAVKAMNQGMPLLARHHQLKAEEHATAARAYRFAILGGRTAPDWVDYETGEAA